jgi:hypothetical protein
VVGSASRSPQEAEGRFASFRLEADEKGRKKRALTPSRGRA